MQKMRVKQDKKLNMSTGASTDWSLSELKNSNDSISLPEESHTPGSLFAIFNKGGKGLKAVAKYGDDCKKIFEIHTTDHKGLGAHYHPWKDGHPLDAKPLTEELKKLLENASNLK